MGAADPGENTERGTDRAQQQRLLERQGGGGPGPGPAQPGRRNLGGALPGSGGEDRQQDDEAEQDDEADQRDRRVGDGGALGGGSVEDWTDFVVDAVPVSGQVSGGLL